MNSHEDFFPQIKAAVSYQYGEHQISVKEKVNAVQIYWSTIAGV